MNTRDRLWLATPGRPQQRKPAPMKAVGTHACFLKESMGVSPLKESQGLVESHDVAAEDDQGLLDGYVAPCLHT